MDKMFKTIYLEVGSVKKTQMEGNLEVKYLEAQIGSSEASLNNRTQQLRFALSVGTFVNSYEF